MLSRSDLFLNTGEHSSGSITLRGHGFPSEALPPWHTLMLAAACSSGHVDTTPHREFGLVSTPPVAASQLRPANGSSSGSNFCMSFLFTLFLKTGKRKRTPWPALVRIVETNKAYGMHWSCSIFQNASMDRSLWNWLHAMPAC